MTYNNNIWYTVNNQRYNYIINFIERRCGRVSVGGWKVILNKGGSYLQDNLYQLVKERITLGQIIKNYKDLCSILNQGIKSGRSKILQLKDISRYVKLKKDKQQFTVIEIYKEPLPKIDQRQEEI